MQIPDKIPEAVVFTYEAMNTTFSMRFPGMEQNAASGLARECYETLDRLEALLSRFVADSDVSRINAMEAGQTLHITEETHACLLVALRAYEQTGGLFDVTLGSRIEHLKSQAEGEAPAVRGRLMVHPDVAAVTCEEPGRMIDLGGIGKGFALDRMKHMLAEWDAPEFMLTAGASSMLAHGALVWPVDLAGTTERTKIGLQNAALSASGTIIQGSHIVHPAGPEAMPESPCEHVWVTAETAALAEVWSTALMLLPADEITDFLQPDDGLLSVHADCAGGMRKLWG